MLLRHRTHLRRLIAGGVLQGDGQRRASCRHGPPCSKGRHGRHQAVVLRRRHGANLCDRRPQRLHGRTQSGATQSRQLLVSCPSIWRWHTASIAPATRHSHAGTATWVVSGWGCTFHIACRFRAKAMASRAPPTSSTATAIIASSSSAAATGASEASGVHSSHRTHPGPPSPLSTIAQWISAASGRGNGCCEAESRQPSEPGVVQLPGGPDIDRTWGVADQEAAQRGRAGQRGGVLWAGGAAGRERRDHRGQPQVRLAHLAVHLRGVRVAAVGAHRT
jgi:hypothetical protein